MAVSSGAKRMIDELRKPLPKPPTLAWKTWEHRGKVPLFDKAIKALEKPADSVTARNRKAVHNVMEKLYDDANRGSGSRVQYFVTSLGMSAVVGRNPVAALIQDNLHRLPKALNAFADEKKPIGTLQQAAIAYLMRWAELGIGEKQTYDRMNRRLKSMAASPR